MSIHTKNPVVLLLDPRGISTHNSPTVTKRLDEYAKQLVIQSSDNSLSLVVLSSSKSHMLRSKILKHVKIYYISCEIPAKEFVSTPPRWLKLSYRLAWVKRSTNSQSLISSSKRLKIL